MDPKRKKIWRVIWGAVIVAIILLFPRKDASPPGVLNTGQPLSLPEAGSPQEGNLPPLAETGSLQMQWQRDPFVRQEQVTSAIGASRLTGIIFDGNQQEQSYAIIDGQLVREGDRVDGSRVIQIRTGSVVIGDNGGTKELFLNQ